MSAEPTAMSLKKLPIMAALVAIAGIIDSVYLTVHHYTFEPVPCTLTGEGCEMVLTSRFAEILGIPLSAFGIAAYLFAFLLAMVAIFGKRGAWMLYGIQATLMAGFSCWLIYIQAFYIHAFCQFCLLSAATSISLFLIFIASFPVGTFRKTAVTV